MVLASPIVSRYCANVYVCSYLGYGLMAGRAKIIDAAAQGSAHPCFVKVWEPLTCGAKVVCAYFVVFEEYLHTCAHSHITGMRERMLAGTFADRTYASTPLRHETARPARIYTHMHAYTNTHLHVQLLTHSHLHVHTNIRTHTRICAHTRKYKRTLTLLRTHTYNIRTQTNTHTHTHTHTRTHTHIHTRTHIHTHTTCRVLTPTTCSEDLFTKLLLNQEQQMVKHVHPWASKQCTPLRRVAQIALQRWGGVGFIHFQGWHTRTCALTHIRVLTRTQQ